MKVLILCGGLGTRLGEDSQTRPKPMVDLGNQPVLWHIMKHYAVHGFKDFVLLAGYKSEVIKNYFANYQLHSQNIVFNLKKNTMEVFPNHESPVEDWTVTVLETGATTMTGGRVKRAETIVGREPFLLTYGDGLSDVDISKTVFEHQESGRLITMTAVQPEGRFGTLELVDGQVKSFLEKPKGDNNWINGGFFVCQPEVFDAIENTTDAIFERKALEDLAGRGQINCYKHRGFWKCMDTLADKNNLIKMWESGEAPWKTW